MSELLKKDLVSKKSEIEFKLNETLNQLKKEYINLYSIKLLIQLIDEEKETLNKNIVLPLQERLARAFNKITDNKYNNLFITEDFNIAKLQANASDGKVEADINSISFGTKEQLAFLFRFTVAQFLSNKEPQIMILDDSFVNTDYHRLKEIIEMINQFSNKIQFLPGTVKIIQDLIIY